MTAISIDQAYAHCLNIVQGHYENFPVASVLLPRRLRRPVAAIYAFARRADDWADEGDYSEQRRLAELDAMRVAVHGIELGQESDDPVFIALADSVREHRLPIDPFLDLLSAFRQDVTQKHYADFGELMQYCRRSANPVGRLLLHLYKTTDARNLAYSDAICSALQLINFLQDLHQDYAENGRIYLPQDEMARFGVTERQLAERHSDLGMRRLVHFQAQRAQQLLHSGAALGSVLKGRAGFELRMILLGGNRVLHYLQTQGNVFSRPRLSKGDRWKLVWGALRGGVR